MQGAVSGVKMRPAGGILREGETRCEPNTWQVPVAVSGRHRAEIRHGREDSGCVAEGFFAKSDIFSQLKCPQEGLNA